MTATDTLRHSLVSPRGYLGGNRYSRGFSELSKPGDNLVSTDEETDPERKGERSQRCFS